MSAHHCSLYEPHGTTGAGDRSGLIPMPELDAMPDHWRAVLTQGSGQAILGARGSRLLILAAGPLIPVARALAALREERQWGATDALPADEPRMWREWDAVLAISAGEGEPELMHALRHLPPRVTRHGVSSSSQTTLGPLVDELTMLPEPSAGSLVAQESALLLSARCALGETLDQLPRCAETVLMADTPETVPGISHIAIIGSGSNAPLSGSPAHALGLCLGGLHLRAMANAAAGHEPFLSLTTVGTPNRGSELADAYNGLRLGHRFKDARADVACFNALPQSGLPVRSVVLQASHALDVRYMLTAPLQQALHGAETHAWPWQVPTDGLLLAEDQALGEVAAVWDTDHAGMINEGRAASYFDAYAAYEALLGGLP